MADASGLVTAANAGSWDSLGVLSPLTLSVLAEQGYVSSLENLRFHVCCVMCSEEYRQRQTVL